LEHAGLFRAARAAAAQPSHDISIVILVGFAIGWREALVVVICPL
jgi:hypothetical protein